MGRTKEVDEDSGYPCAVVGPSANNKSSTLPLSYRYCTERQNSKDRDGYYSDRNEIIREKRERERDADRDRGYLSDYSSR